MASEADGRGCHETGLAAQESARWEAAVDSATETMLAREAALRQEVDLIPVLELLGPAQHLTRDQDSRLHQTIRRSFRGRKVVSPIWSADGCRRTEPWDASRSGLCRYFKPMHSCPRLELLTSRRSPHCNKLAKRAQPRAEAPHRVQGKV